MKCTPWSLKLYQPFAFGGFAVTVQVALSVVLQDVVLSRHRVGLQAGGAQQLGGGVEFGWFGQMGDVSGVDQEGGFFRHLRDLAQSLLEGASDVGVDGLVKAEMAVADLRETEAAFGGVGLTDQRGAGNAAGDGP